MRSFRTLASRQVIFCLAVMAQAQNPFETTEQFSAAVVMSPFGSPALTRCRVATI